MSMQALTQVVSIGYGGSLLYTMGYDGSDSNQNLLELKLGFEF